MKLLYSQDIYNPPSWISEFIPQQFIPSTRINLGQLPTPIHRLNKQTLSGPYELWLKRDDLSSFDLTGNKVRKLEFLLADASQKGHDSVITIGGLQSNHARATAVAAKQIGLEPHLILRTPESPSDIDLTGNLLFNRLVGAHIHTVTPSIYAQIGSKSLTKQLQTQLITEKGLNPYIIPVGGSNNIGLFGYLECVHEILTSAASGETPFFDHIVFACGSGGTAMGLSLGFRLYELSTYYKQLVNKHIIPQIHAINVCDSPEYFYSHIEELTGELQLDIMTKKLGPIRSRLTVSSGVGVGYARSTDEELSFIRDFASTYGILLG